MDETNVARTRMWAPATIKPECHSSRPKQRERDYVQACCVNIEHAVEQWGDTVFRLALCRVGNRADAEDVVQTVFMKLCQSTKPIKDSEHLKAWLLRVTLTCCADVHRNPWKTRQATGEETQIALENASIERDSIAFCDADSTSNEAFVRSMVAALPERQRIAVHLHYFEGYSTNEIAQITDENPATVRSHLHRARASLKLKMGGTNE